MTMNKTYSPKPGDIERAWLVVDATDLPLGRLASEIATVLRGKHKPTYAPHVDGGDFVIVVNAEKVAVTSDKSQTKIYYRHSGYPGGIKAETFDRLRERRPEATTQLTERPVGDAGHRREQRPAIECVGTELETHRTAAVVGWSLAQRSEPAGPGRQTSSSKLEASGPGSSTAT